MSLPPPPSVPFFPAGYEPKQADLQAWWYNNAAFLQNKIVFRGRQTTTTNLLPASGAVQTLGIDTVDEDPFSGWDSGASAWTPPAGYSAWYQVTVTLFTEPLGSGEDIRPGLGGTYNQHLATVHGSTAHVSGAEGTWTVYLIGGLDTATATGALLNAGSPVLTSLAFGLQSSLEIMWLSL